MIVKDKAIQNAVSATAKAGLKQEHDVAFYLRRAFKDHTQVHVINDIKFSFNDETAQIDHLIIYTYGFVLIESKSIKGEVKVNDLGEWTRSLNGKWSGMPSPIKQVELQQKLLREMLFANREKILGKLLGIKQQSFGGRCWDNVCAVSSNAIIDRESMPRNVSKQLVKTEFLVDKLQQVMKLRYSVVNMLNPLDTRPEFNGAELKSITTFLMTQLSVSPPPKKSTKKTIKKIVIKKPETNVQQTTNQATLQCKSCAEPSDYTAQHGRYGYFIKCNKCETNTAMKTPCLNCHSKNTKVKKRKETYTLGCSDCEMSHKLI